MHLGKKAYQKEFSLMIVHVSKQNNNTYHIPLNNISLNVYKKLKYKMMTRIFKLLVLFISLAITNVTAVHAENNEGSKETLAIEMNTGTEKSTALVAEINNKKASYVENKNGNIEKYTKGIFDYSIKNEIEYTVKKTTEGKEYLFTNTKSQEYFTLFNIIEKDGVITFSVKKDDGQIIKGLSLTQFGAEKESLTTEGPYHKYSALIMVAVIEAFGHLSIKDCGEVLKQVSACPEGMTKYMNYSSKMWGKSCDVGCQKL